jgi:cyclopropane fatty-acyl-phospholipid synthase-like methyltransferase
MAKAYPDAKIIGFDYHQPSIEWARKHIEKEGLRNIRFEVVRSTDYPGDDYDLVTFFDCFHNMGDPIPQVKCRILAAFRVDYVPRKQFW